VALISTPCGAAECQLVGAIEQDVVIGPFPFRSLSPRGRTANPGPSVMSYPHASAVAAAQGTAAFFAGSGLAREPPWSGNAPSRHGRCCLASRAVQAGSRSSTR
jgi:hypothetical protein